MTDQVTIKSTPPDSAAVEAHNAAMIAKVDGTPTPEATPAPAPAQTPSAERPSWLPEKFASPEDMAKAYAELETKQGGKPADPPAPELNPDGTPKTPEGVPADDAAAKELESKGLNLTDFSTEFSQKGELSTESYEKLEKAGYPKTIVDQYIAGQQALAVNYQQDVMSAAGGSEKFEQVASWAAENLTDSEKVAYNKAIDSGNADQAKLAVAGITAKFDAANPPEGNLLAGRFSNAVGDRYESTAQVTADMAKPEYRTDPAFRKKVQDKIARSDVM